MELSAVIDKIDSIGIVSIVESYGVSLKQAGVNFKACCPFHNEKTASFIVSPVKNIATCFGCNKTWKSIKFVEEKEGLTFIEAVEDICRKYHINFVKGKATEEQIEKAKEKESLQIIANFAKNYYSYSNRKIITIKNYLYQRRVSIPIANLFEIGYADGCLRSALTQKGYKEELAKKVDLIKNNGNGNYDYFRNRIIYPIHDPRGNIVGFGGRSFPENKKYAKFLNTTNNVLYNKSNLLYAFHLARESIKKKNRVYLVEGYQDVIRLFQCSADNTVATCGTALTKDQIKLIKSITRNDRSVNVTILRDGDDAGYKAALRDGDLLLSEGIIPDIVILPEGEDPDSFFTSTEHFDSYIKKNQQDFVMWYVGNLWNNSYQLQRLFSYTGRLKKRIQKAKEDFNEGKYKLLEKEYAEAFEKIDKLKNTPAKDKGYNLEKIVGIMRQLPSMHVDAYTNDIHREFNIPKKNLKFKVIKSEEEKENLDDILPKHVDRNEYMNYGFYEDNNCYYFRTKDNPKARVSNFVFKPIFHVKADEQSTRTYQIINVNNYKEYVDLDMTAITSLSNLRRVVESKGNFLWEGNETQFIRLKSKLYDNTLVCDLVENLGWQKRGFFAFANGISFEGVFQKTDENGVVSKNGVNYYIPALSRFYRNDPTKFQKQKKVVYKLNADISFSDWTHQFLKVFKENDNGIIALCALTASIFRDLFLNKLNFFPLLNCYGAPQSGKSGLAKALMYLTGEAQDFYNYNNGTIVGMAEHVAEFNNVPMWIDEYKNETDPKKVEMLKSFYDGIARIKGKNKQDSAIGGKTETTLCNSFVILTGQEIPNKDFALLTRVIPLRFFKSKYTEEEGEEYLKLKDMQQHGLSHFMVDLIKHRDKVQSEFWETYNSITKKINIDFPGCGSDRLIANMGIILTPFKILEDELDFNLTYEDAYKACMGNLLEHSSLLTSSKEISIFWDTIAHLAMKGALIEGTDFKIAAVEKVKLGKKPNIEERIFGKPHKLLYLRMTNVYQLYAEKSKSSGQAFLDKSSLLQYLKYSGEYIGYANSIRFDNNSIASAFVFDYEKLESFTDIQQTQKSVNPQDEELTVINMN